jgi:1-acyl-sn-glycerol-3-phosphate acyltransferase
VGHRPLIARLELSTSSRSWMCEIFRSGISIEMKKPGVSLLTYLIRLGGMITIFAGTTSSYLMVPGNRRSLLSRARWLQRWSRRTLGVLGMEVEAIGVMPTNGVVASNHLSYLDILVLSSVHPQIFLAKKEVSGWPLFGAFARWAGTIFIDRGRRSDVTAKAKAFHQIIESGLPLTLFLEGTTSDGSTVLPFRTALLEPAIQGGWPVTPCAIHYEAVGADPAQSICYHGSMTLVPHFLGLIGRVVTAKATVRYGRADRSRSDRKQMAIRLHQEVLDLKIESASAHAVRRRASE